MFFSRTTCKLFTAALILSMCIAQAALAEEAQVPAEAPAAEQETVVAKTIVKTLGQEAADAIQLKITNHTGKDLDFFSVSAYTADPLKRSTVYKVQEALIAAGYLNDVADGVAGPNTQAAISAYREAQGLSADGGADDEMMTLLLGAGYDGNLLEKDDVFTAGESRALYIPKAQDQDAAGEAEAAEDPVAEALKAFSMEPEYVVTFREKGQDREYTLYVFPAEMMEKVQLDLDGDTAYIMYTIKGAVDFVTTLDAEKAVAAAVAAAADVQEETAEEPETAAQDTAAGDSVEEIPDDDGYDADADTGYEDTGYEDTGYEDTGYDVSDNTSDEEPAPAAEDVYIVAEEFYPSCDDGSHGVHYIEYSDGTTEQIEY